MLALIVLGGHVTDFCEPGHRVPWTAFGGVFHANIAVVAFLMISGYSMAHSIRKPRGFYRRRFWRIMPLYASSLLLGWVVVAGAGGAVQMPNGMRIDLPNYRSFFQELFFLQGWTIQPLRINMPLWSLSFEVFYYVLTPLFARLRPWMLCCLIVISASRFWYQPMESGMLLYGDGMLGLAWSWLAGFYWYRYRTEWTRIVVMALGCLFAVQKFLVLAPVTIAVGWCFVTSAGSLPIHRRLRVPLLYLGELSYPLYALHWPAVVGLYGLCHVVNPFAWLGSGVLAAIVAYHCIDRLVRKTPLVRADRARAGAASDGKEALVDDARGERRRWRFRMPWPSLIRWNRWWDLAGNLLLAAGAVAFSLLVLSTYQTAYTDAYNKVAANPPSPLPVQVRLRPRASGQGAVLQFQNMSTKPLDDVVIVCENPGNKSARRIVKAAWPSGEVVEIGEDDGWVVAPGQRVVIQAAGFGASSLTLQ